MTENSGKVNNRLSINQSKIDTETQSIQTNEFKKGCARRMAGYILAKIGIIVHLITHLKKKNSSVSVKPVAHVKMLIFPIKYLEFYHYSKL